MLARFNPWEELFALEREMTDLSRRFLGGGFLRAIGRTNGTTWAPAVDVVSRDGDLVVRAELPGVDPERDVDISLEDGVLTIRGERRHEDRTDGENYVRVESTYGSFLRRIPVPHDVKTEDVKATYKDGILEVVVPRAAELPASKRIPITVGSDQKALDAKSEKK